MSGAWWRGVEIGPHRLCHGDALEVLRTMPEASVDSIVTDPPYGLSFMGKKWDYDVPAIEVWVECLRVLKPGGYLLAFAGTRTQHRMAVRIEDAGFEIRDLIAWVYGSGFPKSRNLDGEHEGWGTALKPSLEPITVARKPLIGTVAENVRQHGTGAINIDECRIATDEPNPSIERRKGAINHLSDRPARESEAMGKMHSRQSPEAYRADRAGEALGRWPANLIHDGSDEVLAAFPAAPRQMADISINSGAHKTKNVYGAMRRERGDEPSANSQNEGGVGFKMRPGARRLDSGSAARFFYCAKTSRQDRNEGCDAPPKAKGGMVSNTSGQHITRRDEGYEAKPQANNHPTVKPTDLMRYLCRLVTPKRGIVLDPFAGSGSTGKACAMEGFAFIGIEREAAYIDIATARIGAAQSKPLQGALL